MARNAAATASCRASSSVPSFMVSAIWAITRLCRSRSTMRSGVKATISSTPNPSEAVAGYETGTRDSQRPQRAIVVEVEPRGRARPAAAAPVPAPPPKAQHHPRVQVEVAGHDAQRVGCGADQQRNAEAGKQQDPAGRRRRLITASTWPCLPGTWPKYSAVAQPSANDADRPMTCHTSSSTNGRNGMPAHGARRVPGVSPGAAAAPSWPRPRDPPTRSAARRSTARSRCHPGRRCRPIGSRRDRPRPSAGRAR